MKKLLCLVICTFMALSLASCNNSDSSGSDEVSQSSVSISAKEKYESVTSQISMDGDWSDIEEDYMKWLGFSDSDYSDFRGSFKTGDIDVVLIVKPAEGKSDTVKDILSKQLQSIIGANENYPGPNKDKANAAQIITTPDGFIALAIYGNADKIETDGAEAAVKPLIDALNK